MDSAVSCGTKQRDTRLSFKLVLDLGSILGICIFSSLLEQVDLKRASHYRSQFNQFMNYFIILHLKAIALFHTFM